MCVPEVVSGDLCLCASYSLVYSVQKAAVSTMDYCIEHVQRNASAFSLNGRWRLFSYLPLF